MLVWLRNSLHTYLARFRTILWTDTAKAPSKLQYLARLFYVLVRDIFNGKLRLRAAALSYTTLLTLVPALALVFYILKTIGIHSQAEPFLLDLLAPLGDKGIELGVKVISYIENIDVGLLGMVGLLLLLYMAMSLVQQMETAYNAIWHVDSHRKLFWRIFVYSLLIITGPTLFFSAIAITAALMNMDVVQKIVNIEGIAFAGYLLNKTVPYLFVIAALTLTYIIIPNTKVNFINALTGGIVAGVLWVSAGWAFASFMTTSVRYQLIYSSFTIVILFLLWLYFSWLIFLIGANLCFYTQNPQHISENYPVEE